MVVELHVCIKSSQLVEWFTDFKHQIRLALKSWLILSVGSLSFGSIATNLN